MAWNSLARIAAAAALSIAAQPLAAQINEADRLQRCQNNRDALALLEAEAALASDERIARLDLAERTVSRAWPEFQAAYDEWNSTPSRSLDMNGVRSWTYSPRLREVLERIANAARAADVYCAPDDGFGSLWACVRDLRPRISNSRLTVVSSMSDARRAQVRQQIRSARTNLVALRCDQARAPDVADIGGSWRGLDGTVYSITQSGNQFSWTRSGTDERATGTISGASMSAQWASSQGSGGGGASIQFGPNGVPVQIRWSNGNVFTR